MKSKITCLFLLFAAPLLHGQTAPTLMSYQGRVTDAAGVLIGNTSPVNRDVIFKLYTLSSGGTPIYAEKQSVTISGGEFSVLIGDGAAVPGIVGPPTTLSTIINSNTYTNLYLGITVDDGTADVDSEISPRQQMVSGAFAMRAKVAETVAGSAITTTMLGDSQVTNGKIAVGAVNGSRIANNSITASHITDSVITAGKLDATSIGVWTPTGSSVYRAAGNVGIGEANPSIPLHFQTGVGNKIALSGPFNAHYGFGIQSFLMQIYTNGSSADIAFGHGGNSASFGENMRIKGNGNVGIGTSAPAEKLDVVGNVQASRLFSNGVVRARGGNYGANSTNTGFSFDSNGDSTGGMFSGAAGTLQFYTGANERLRIDATGNVGIGNTSPNAKLAIGGNLGGSAKSSTFTTYSGTLGTTSGNEKVLASFGCTTGNWSNLAISAYRNGNGTDWTSASMLLGMNVDNSLRPGGYLAFNRSGIGVNTLDSSQGVLSVGGGITAIGSRNSSIAYATMSYRADRGGIAFDVYNTSQGGTTAWRSFSFDGDSNIDFYSDRRLKKDIEPAEPMLDRLMQLPLHRFRWKDNEETTQKHEFGVIAQEVQPLFPDIVGETDDGILTVGYGTFATIACKSIQELKVQVDEGAADVRGLLKEKDQKIADLETRIAALEQLIQSGN